MLESIGKSNATFTKVKVTLSYQAALTPSVALVYRLKISLIHHAHRIKERKKKIRLFKSMWKKQSQNSAPM